MFRSNQRREGMTIAIFGLWRNWAVAVGFLTMLTMLAPIVPKQWLAPINIACYIALQWVHSVLRKRDIPSCSRLIQEVSSVMLITAVALVVIYFFSRGGVKHELTGQPYTMDTPLISILITAPVACLVTLWHLLRGKEPKVCRDCHTRYGNVIEHGFPGLLFRKEWRYQTSLLFLLSLLLSVVDWGYYLVHYVNVNLNRADLFFFLWLPLAMYVLSLIYLGGRYYSMWIYYCQNDEEPFVERPGTTTMRFLIIWADKIFLTFHGTANNYPNGAKIKKFDTPVVIRTPYRERENLHSAITEFDSKTGISNAEIKLIYSSPDDVTYQNMFHYFAFVDNADIVAESDVEGEWMTWGNLCHLASQGLLTRDLVSEIDRVYNISMAWKTYDKEGRRLYKIKHYKPTFRLRDIRNWEVDFNDRRWLNIARNNEDCFGFRLKKIFAKHLKTGKG